MRFFELILHNLWRKQARSIGLLLAVAVAVMTVVALDVTSSGLEQSAAAIISIGKADFTVAQKGASSVLTSTIDREQLGRVRQTPGVARARWASLSKPSTSTPTIPCSLRSGSNPAISRLWCEGRRRDSRTRPRATTRSCWAGRRPPTSGSTSVTISRPTAPRTSLSVSIPPATAFGDAGAMFPLPAIQGYNRLPGIVTLAFVKVQPGYSIVGRGGPGGLRPAPAHDYPHRQPVRERRHKPGLPAGGCQRQHGAGHPHWRHHCRQYDVALALRANTRVRASAGLRLDPSPDGRLAARREPPAGLRRRRPSASLCRSSSPPCSHSSRRSRASLHPNFTEGAFWRALFTALVMTFLGALYPTTRAAFLSPLKALSYE